MNKLINNEKLIPSLIPLILAIFIYILGFNNYFQQDEWLVFGDIIQNNQNSTILKDAFQPAIGHYVPLHKILTSYIYLLIGLNFSYWYFIALFFHLVNIYLVYILFSLITKDWKFSMGGSILFAFNASSLQVLTWPAANFNTIMTTTLAIISIILFFRGKYVMSSWLIFFSSFFKEIALPILGVYLLYKIVKKRSIKLPVYLHLLVPIAVYVCLRLFLAFNIYSNPANLNADVNYTFSIFELFYNFITIPFKVFIQTILYIQSYLFLLKSIFMDASDLFVETYLLEFISLILVSSFILLFYFLIYKKVSKKNQKYVVFFVFYIILTSLIYSFSPEKSGILYIVDSRNIYLPSLGVFFILLTFLNEIDKRSKYNIYFIFLILFTFWNIIFIITIFNNVNNISATRRTILTDINYSQDIPDKLLLLTISDTTYFGMPLDEKILPFQSGFGQTALIWYSQKNYFPSEYYQNRYLWEILDQGYKEVDGQGYGYYRDYDLMLDTMKEYNLTEENVIAFYWQGRLNALSDITEEVRLQIAQDLETVENEKN